MYWGVNLKLHSHQTPDQPPTNADQFLWLGRVWSGKKLSALIEERIYPRSTPAVPALYPWCTHAQIPLFPTYPRPSGWPIPALHDQSPTYSWCNYAHYAQYRTNPRSVCLISTPGLKWIIQTNVIPTDSLMRVQYPKGAYWPILIIKSDWKWCIHLSRSLFLYPRIEWSGAYFFVLSVCLFVCLFVCLCVVNFNLRYNFGAVRDRDFIFGMHTSQMMPFQMTPRSMTLWPWIWPWS